MAELGRRSDCQAVVAAATDHGSEVLAHLGAATGLPMAANCLTAAREGGAGEWRYSRQRWGGSLVEEGVLEGLPALFTVATDTIQAVSSGTASAGLVIEPFEPSLQPADLSLRAGEARSTSTGVSLASARVVVSGGRGVGSPEGFQVLEELAELLGGAVGVSRVATSLGWKPHSQQVGQTGTRVSPDVYIACGISGAIQHLAGCQSAKTMIAINTDPTAAIMHRADYAVIGDLHEVLPALVAALKERAGR
jgi:electron transfer flavoprotein alpha subunit